MLFATQKPRLRAYNQLILEIKIKTSTGYIGPTRVETPFLATPVIPALYNPYGKEVISFQRFRLLRFC
jgi:hypothetical protein